MIKGGVTTTYQLSSSIYIEETKTIFPFILIKFLLKTNNLRLNLSVYQICCSILPTEQGENVYQICGRLKTCKQD